MPIFVTTYVILSATIVLLPGRTAKKQNNSIVSRNNDQEKPASVTSPTYVTVYGLHVPINKHLIWSLL